MTELLTLSHQRESSIADLTLTFPRNYARAPLDGDFLTRNRHVGT